MNKVLKAYKESIEPLDEGTLATQDFIAVHGKELDPRAVKQMIDLGHGLYDVVSSMKNLKRILPADQYRGLVAAIKSDINQGI